MNRRGFTLIELLVVVSIMGLMASVILASLTSAQLQAHDKRRVADLKEIEAALNLYYSKYNSYPTEASGANGNMSTNPVFKTLMTGSNPRFLQAVPVDPVGLGSPTFYYYYDGKANCGGKEYAVIFARQMDKPENSNYDAFLNTTCSGVVDGEGRGGGTRSYNVIVGNSSDR